MRTRVECNCCSKLLSIPEVYDSPELEGMCFECFRVVKDALLDLEGIDGE